MRTEYMELRNIVLVEPESKEFVHLSYLGRVNENMTEARLLNACGGTLKGLGMSKVSMLLKIGIYPAYIYYERDGRVVRECENAMDGFDLVEDNIYQVNKNGMKTFTQMQRRKKQAAA